MSTDHPDLHRLTGAYALNALSDDEREAFEAHLDSCGACARETAELLETAARFGGLLQAGAPPPQLREDVLDRIGRTRQEPPGETERLATPVARLLGAPDVRTFPIRQQGVRGRLIVSGSRREVAFAITGMEPAPQGYTYQTWIIGGDGPVPAGIFDVVVEGEVIQSVEGDVADAEAVSVTIEPAGGSPQPTTEPVLLVALSS